MRTHPSRTVGLTVTIALTLLALAAVGIIGATTSWATGGGHQPVTVCHKPGTPAQQDLTFDQAALWQAHLRHGDTLGPRPPLPTPTPEPTWTPTPDPTPTTSPTAAPSPTSSPSPSPSSTPTTPDGTQPSPEPSQPTATSPTPTSDPAPAVVTNPTAPAAPSPAAAPAPDQPATSAPTELAATGTSAVGFIAVVALILAGTFAVGLGRRGQR